MSSTEHELLFLATDVEEPSQEARSIHIACSSRIQYAEKDAHFGIAQSNLEDLEEDVSKGFRRKRCERMIVIDPVVLCC